MGQKGVLTAQDYLIVTFATLNNEEIIDLDSNLLLHFITNGHQLEIIDNCNVELRHQVLGIVRVVEPEHRVVVINLLVSLRKEMIEPITLDGLCATH